MRPSPLSPQRGATLVSVLLLVLALGTLGLLGLRSSARELRGAGAQVARERAWHSAHAVLALAQVRLGELSLGRRNAVLAGNRPQGPACPDPCRDCPPTGRTVVSDDPGSAGTCTSEPCLRPGAVARLPDRDGSTVHWCRIPLRQLLEDADTDATVSLWVRNDTADALDGGGWTNEQNDRVVITAIAEVRGSRVVVRESVTLPAR